MADEGKMDVVAPTEGEAVSTAPAVPPPKVTIQGKKMFDFGLCF
jgi:hypothetical protein